MIINSYLPKNIVLLCLSFKNVSSNMGKSWGIITSKENKTTVKTTSSFEIKEDNTFISICSDSLIQTMPLSYLEGLKEIELNAEKGVSKSQK